MPSKYDGWAIKGPKGQLVAATFDTTKSDAWYNAYVWLNSKLGWDGIYWKRERPAKNAARKAGYILVPVKLVEFNK